MILTTDISLDYILWERADEELHISPDGFFKRLIDIYILACAIGISEDQIYYPKEDEKLPESKTKSIGRAVYLNEELNSEIHDLMSFLLKNALINTKHINYDISKRLELAFNPSIMAEDIKPANFLTGFANYGIKEIYKYLENDEYEDKYEIINKMLEEKSSIYDVARIIENAFLEEQLKNS